MRVEELGVLMDLAGIGHSLGVVMRWGRDMGEKGDSGETPEFLTWGAGSSALKAWLPEGGGPQMSLL